MTGLKGKGGECLIHCLKPVFEIGTSREGSWTWEGGRLGGWVGNDGDVDMCS